MHRKSCKSPQSLIVVWIAAALAFVTVSVSACAAPGQTEQVVIAPLGSSGDVSASGMTREELEDHVRRFADRYMTRIGLVSFAAIVNVAIGPNAVTNLLDMMTLTRLSRLVVESYWVPEVLGEELGRDFQTTFVDLEEDIWAVADDVLTQQHQEELRSLVDEWHAENPEQIYPWYVRLSNFSGQRAASLAAVQQSGGLLKEVARAREAAEEIQAFGERVLFYLQRAPRITSIEFETSVGDVLGGPEISRAMNDMDRFVASVERLVDVIEKLPGARIAVVDQLMDRVSEERRALWQDLSGSQSDLRGLIAELQPALESFERTMVVAKTRNPDSRPFDVNEYRGLVADAATTAIELRLLLQSVDNLLGNSSDLAPLIGHLVEAENAIVDRLMLQLIALIFIFFAALLGYRYVAGRMFSK